MPSPSKPSKASKKRITKDFEREREEVAELMRDVKRRRTEVDYDGSLYETQDGIEVRRLEGNVFASLASAKDCRSPLSEDNPETWTPRKLDELFGALEEKTKPATKMQLSPQDEQTLQPNMQIVADWNMNEGEIGQETAHSEQGANLGPVCPSSEGERQQHVVDTTQQIATDALVPPKAPAQFSCQPQAVSSTNPYEQYKDECRKELDKQDRVLNLLLSGPTWDKKWPLETRQLMKRKWVAKARQYERDFSSEFGINIPGIDYQNMGKGEMLLRQGELLQTIFFRNHPMPPNATYRASEKYQKEMATIITTGQLSALRSWTAEWEQELRDLQMNASNPLVLDDAIPQHKALQMKERSKSPPANLRASAICGGGSRPQKAVLQDTRVLQQGDSMSLAHVHAINQLRAQTVGAKPLDFSPLHHEEWATTTGGGWQKSSVKPMHSNPVQDEPEHPFFERDPFSAHSGTLLPTQSASLAQNPSPYPPNPRPKPALAFGMVRPQQSNTAVPTAGASNSGAVMIPPKGKRGAPRKRMFESMPTTDTSLSARAQVDNEEVLKSFPEHLCTPEVMRRFVRPAGSQSGGWPTGRMVDFLMKHKNAKDFVGITKEERRANLKRWVTKERDSCNNKKRKAARLAEKKAIIGSTASQMSPATPTLQTSEPTSNESVQPLHDVAYSADPTPTLGTQHGAAVNMLDPAPGLSDFHPHWQAMDPAFTDIGPAPEMLHPDAYWQQAQPQSFLPTDDGSEELDMTGQIDEGWAGFEFQE